MKTRTIDYRKVAFVVILMLLFVSTSSYAQEALQKANDALNSNKSGVVALLKTIMEYLVALALLFLGTNFVFNYTQSKAASGAAIAVLIISAIMDAVL